MVSGIFAPRSCMWKVIRGTAYFREFLGACCWQAQSTSMFVAMACYAVDEHDTVSPETSLI